MTASTTLPGTSQSLPPPPVAALSPRKVEILDGLEAIVLAEGFRKLRLADVAKRLGTSYTTLYQLAPTRDELVLLVVERWYHRNGVETWARVEAESDPVQRLMLWIEGAQRGVAGVSGRFWDDAVSHAAVARLIENYTRYYLSVLEMLIEEGIAANAFRPVNARIAATVFEAAGARLLDPEARRSDAAWGPSASVEFVDLILGGLLAR